MRIRDALDPGCIFLDLEASDGAEAIAVVARGVASTINVEAELIADALTQREKLGSTSVGNGFAIPHCKLPGLDEIFVALARLTNGVDFGGNGQQHPVSFFFVVLSPPDQPAAHLQVLSQIARILKNPRLRVKLLDVDGPQEVVNAIREAADEEGL